MPAVRDLWRRHRRPVARPAASAAAAITALLALGACGQAVKPVATRTADTTLTGKPLPMTATALRRTLKASPRQTAAIDRATRVAERRYTFEQRGRVVRALLRRVAADTGLRAAVRTADDAAMRAAVARRFDSVWYHWHVSRLLIVRHRRTVVDVGVPFVISPSSRPLRNARGRTVATLEISDQDVIGFVRFMHRNHGVEVVARGTHPGHVCTSLPAARSVWIPDRGERTIAGRRYLVRAFTRHALGGERVKIWILLRA